MPAVSEDAGESPTVDGLWSLFSMQVRAVVAIVSNTQQNPSQEMRGQSTLFPPICVHWYMHRKPGKEIVEC